MSYRYVAEDGAVALVSAPRTIRARGCSAALLSPAQPRFGYWVDPAPANRPPCPV
ncbi:hypothetical protein [Actinophytocola glycyrrhizae]|uniref:Uncharacterized protein n=1 Tax=Actinophytocola glycyrrhizae TaxID=2044873 RepID=A0ABV9SHQ9_9PSEU